MRKEMEMMRILRTPPMGKLVVEIQKHRFANLAELEGDEKAIRIINAAIGELVAFAGGYEELVKAGVAPALTPAASPDALPAAGDMMSKEQAAFLAQMEAERDAMQAGTASSAPPPMMSPTEVVALADEMPDQQKPPPPPPAPTAVENENLSIVEQIDAILQQYVAESPEFANRSIHIIQSPAGGVNIEVDGKLYGRPQEVEDPAVQATIKKALKVWEDQ